ncbi:hypothetical protein IHE44_0014136, partial [Lamprotornis superbus]
EPCPTAHQSGSTTKRYHGEAATIWSLDLLLFHLVTGSTRSGGARRSSGDGSCSHEGSLKPGSADAEAALGSARALLGSALGTAGPLCPHIALTALHQTNPFRAQHLSFVLLQKACHKKGVSFAPGSRVEQLRWLSCSGRARQLLALQG